MQKLSVENKVRVCERYKLIFVIEIDGRNGEEEQKGSLLQYLLNY